jgi:integrase
LEFTILTAARSGEVLGAHWDEIDRDAKVWTIPAPRMKAGVEHRVPLPERAVAILRVMGGSDQNGSDRVFPRLAPMTMNKILPPGVTIHGFRSSFRDWSAEQTHCSREVCEQALAHATGSAEQAYRRTDLLEKRRGLMEQWARYCEPGDGGNVVSLTREASQ